MNIYEQVNGTTLKKRKKDDERKTLGLQEGKRKWYARKQS
jgi:hypothetical protein